MTAAEGAPRPQTNVDPVTGVDLELLTYRKQLAIQVTGLISDVLDVDVRVDHLITLAQDEEPSEVRLAARRALRCVESIVKPESEVVKAVGEVGLYHYVESVIDYGASEKTYLALMQIGNLTAEEVTSLYSLRHIIAEQTNGQLPGFPTLINALEHLGMSPRLAAADPEATATALDEAGCFVDHAGGKTFDSPVFWPPGHELPPLGKDIDTVRSDEGREWLRRRLETTMTEDLGLLAQPELTNPYQDLGIIPSFAHDMLRHDSSGVALRTTAKGMFRVLSQIYHPDALRTSDPERFRTISDAHERIVQASGEALLRWAKAEGSAGGEKSAKEAERREAVIHRAAALVHANIQLGSHPQHFSQMKWSQGVLAQRGATTVLLREQDGGLQTLRGKMSALDKGKGPFDPHTQAFDFRTFMMQHRSFGLEPGTKISAFIDETGRTSILDANLGFIMDITLAVEERRGRRQRRSYARPEYDEENAASAWLRSAEPLLLTTQAPDDSPSGAKAQVMFFPYRASATKSAPSAIRNLSMEVAGSVADESLFKRAKFSRQIGAAAIASDKVSQTVSYFGLAPITTRQLIEKDTGYTPLINPGNSLLLYDTTSQTPVTTDARVIGVLGNGAQV